MAWKINGYMIGGNMNIAFSQVIRADLERVRIVDVLFMLKYPEFDYPKILNVATLSYLAESG